MPTKTLIPVEEYLKMSFDGPEPDYLDGELVERHLGSIPHFKAQKRLLDFFGSLEQNHSLFGYPEVTLKISPRRYRIADVAVFAGGEPQQEYPSQPPEFVIEIVSKDDRWLDIQAKLAEYHAWEVKNVWLVDPWTRKLYVYDRGGLHEVAAYELSEFGVKLPAAGIFAA